MKKRLIPLLLLLTLSANAESSEKWLELLNSGRDKKYSLKPADVSFQPSETEGFEGLVAVGFRQSDGTFNLGSLIWEGKVWTPLAGWAHILQQKGFADADDETRSALFVELMRQSHEKLGIHPYNGRASYEENRPRPVTGSRQADGQHRFVVWFCEEPGNREGPEWRQVVYVVNMQTPLIRVRTLATYHPVPEGLRDFPPIPTESSE